MIQLLASIPKFWLYVGLGVFVIGLLIYAIASFLEMHTRSVRYEDLANAVRNAESLSERTSNALERDHDILDSLGTDRLRDDDGHKRSDSNSD